VVALKEKYMNAKITIHSIWSNRNPGQSAPSYSVEVEAGKTPEYALENAFVYTNTDERPEGRSFCSTTSGDVLEMDGCFWLAETVGFHKLTAEEAAKVLVLSSRDTSFGYADLKAHKLI